MPLVASAFLAVASLAGALADSFTGALAGCLASGLVGALAGVGETFFAGCFAAVLAIGFAAGFLAGLAAGLLTFLAGALAAGLAAGFLAAGFETFLAGALGAGFDAFLALGLGAGLWTFLAGALDFAAACLVFEAAVLGLAAGDFAAGFLVEDLDEGMGDERWEGGMWIYRSHSLGTTEFPQAGGTKRERFDCVKVILKINFPEALAGGAEAGSGISGTVIFGFEFRRVWINLRAG